MQIMQTVFAFAIELVEKRARSKRKTHFSLMQLHPIDKNDTALLWCTLERHTLDYSYVCLPIEVQQMIFYALKKKEATKQATFTVFVKAMSYEYVLRKSGI